ELVKGLLALVVTATQARAAMAADRVDLVDEDDAGGVLLALLEEIAHAACAHADEHLDEVRAGDAEERHARLARDGAREQRLARAGRSHEQNTLGDASAELGELLRVLEELDDLFQLVLRLIDAGDVGEGDLVVVLGEELRLRLAEAHRLAAARLQLSHEEDEEHADDAERHPGDEELREQRLRVFLLEPERHALRAHLLQELRVEWRDGAELLPRLEMALQDLALHGRVLHLAAIDVLVELAGVDFARLAALRPREDLVEGEEEQDQDRPEKERLVRLSHLCSSALGLAGRDGSKSGVA